jgi:hypothetical protein
LLKSCLGLWLGHLGWLFISPTEREIAIATWSLMRLVLFLSEFHFLGGCDE